MGNYTGIRKGKQHHKGITGYLIAHKIYDESYMGLLSKQTGIPLHIIERTADILLSTGHISKA